MFRCDGILATRNISLQKRTFLQAEKQLKPILLLNSGAFLASRSQKSLCYVFVDNSLSLTLHVKSEKKIACWVTDLLPTKQSLTGFLVVQKKLESERSVLHFWSASSFTFSYVTCEFSACRSMFHARCLGVINFSSCPSKDWKRTYLSNVGCERCLTFLFIAQ